MLKLLNILLLSAFLVAVVGNVSGGTWNQNAGTAKLSGNADYLAASSVGRTIKRHIKEIHCTSTGPGTIKLFNGTSAASNSSDVPFLDWYVDTTAGTTETHTLQVDFDIPDIGMYLGTDLSAASSTLILHSNNELAR